MLQLLQCELLIQKTKFLPASSSSRPLARGSRPQSPEPYQLPASFRRLRKRLPRQGEKWSAVESGEAVEGSGHKALAEGYLGIEAKGVGMWS